GNEQRPGETEMRPRSSSAPRSATASLFDQLLLEKPDEFCVGPVEQQDTSRIAALGPIHEPYQAVAQRLHREGSRLHRLALWPFKAVRPDIIEDLDRHCLPIAPAFNTDGAAGIAGVTELAPLFVEGPDLVEVVRCDQSDAIRAAELDFPDLGAAAGAAAEGAAFGVLPLLPRRR